MINSTMRGWMTLLSAVTQKRLISAACETFGAFILELCSSLREGLYRLILWLPYRKCETLPPISTQGKYRIFLNNLV